MDELIAKAIEALEPFATVANMKLRFPAQADYLRARDALAVLKSERGFACVSPRLSPESDTSDDDETYEIGKRDGREEAIAEIDRLTGGDGVYFFSTIPGRGCPDTETMIRGIVERFEEASAALSPTDKGGEDR